MYYILNEIKVKDSTTNPGAPEDPNTGIKASITSTNIVYNGEEVDISCQQSSSTSCFSMSSATVRINARMRCENGKWVKVSSSCSLW